MRSYSRRELHQNDEDLDEYEEDGEGEEAEAWEEDYYNEEDDNEEKEKEDAKPTKEELEYLQLRQRIKESVRKKMKKEHAAVSKGSLENKKKLPYDNYGSFFGPSQPVIAQRVIQESKSLLETQHLASRISNPLGNKKAPASITEGKKLAVHDQRPQTHRVVNELKVKAQKLKDARDYSFLLSDDAELPAPSKEPPPRNVSVPSSDARSARASLKSDKPSMDKHGSRPVSNGREERKPISINRKIQSQAGPHKAAAPTSRPNLTSADPRKQLGSNTGNGPGRPVGPKFFPSKASAPTVERKAPAVGAKNNVAAVRKPPLSKVNPLAQKKHLEQKREIREPQKARVMAKQSVPSKPQVKDPKQGPIRATKPEIQPKKKPARRPFDEDEDEVDYTSVIRRMFRYNPDKYSGRDDDDSDMEANFDDILKEERKSARIAREEDERELRLIEEEERREKMKKKMLQRKQLSRQ